MSFSTLLSSLTTAEGVYFLFILLLTPWIDYLTIDRCYTSSASRLRIYRTGIACLSLFSLLGYLLHDHRTLLHASSALQKRAGWHELYGGWLHSGVAWVTVASCLPSLYVWRRCWVDLSYRVTYSQQLHSLRYLAPVTRGEQVWYAGLSIAAGLCEEFIYRLLLLQWLSQHMSPMAAVAVGVVAFGTAHAYQGAGGVVRAGGAGLMFGLVYVLFGSYWVVAVCHMLADLQVLVLYRPMEDEPEEARKLVSGCKLEVE